MKTNKDFETAILPLLPPEQQSFYRQLTERVYSIKDITIGLKIEREQAKNFVRTIMPPPRTDEGEKRRFDLADLLILSVLYEIENAFDVSRQVLAELYQQLRIAEGAQAFLPLGILRPDHSMNYEPSFAEIAQAYSTSAEISNVAPAIIESLIAVAKVLNSNEEVFIIVYPPDREYKTFRCKFEGTLIFSVMARTAPYHGVMLASATGIVQQTLANLRQAKYKIPFFPFENRILNNNQVLEQKIEKPKINLSHAEQEFIEIIRTIKGQTRIDLFIKDGQPRRVKYEIMHSARDVRPNALLEDGRTISIKSIPGSDRKPSKYIQEIVVEFETPDAVAKSANNS